MNDRARRTTPRGNRIARVATITCCRSDHVRPKVMVQMTTTANKQIRNKNIFAFDTLSLILGHRGPTLMSAKEFITVQALLDLHRSCFYEVRQQTYDGLSLSCIAVLIEKAIWAIFC